MKTLMIAGLSLLGTSVAAQDSEISFTLGAGVQSLPEFFGSDDSETEFTGTLVFDRVKLGFIDIGGGDPNGFNFKFGSRYIDERNSSDDSSLAGLADIDESLELGGGLSYTIVPDGQNQNWGVFAFGEIRYGVVGHESFVAEAGIDAVYKPIPRFEVRAGPRLFGGDDDYADIYFSDPRVGFEADGGLLSQGFQVSAAYDLNDKWGIEGVAKYEQLINDAEDSPIVEAGDDEQLSFGLLLTRSFTFKF